MSVPVMQVGIMRVQVPQGFMAVKVRMWLVAWIVGAMRMLVMLVMDMPMRVFEHFMLMLMLVTFGEMKIDANAHKGGGPHELRGQRITE